MHTGVTGMDKKTILIIDDVKFNIRAARDMLGDTYTIIGAMSGEEGLNMLEKICPDLILLYNCLSSIASAMSTEMLFILSYLPFKIPSRGGNES